MNYKKGFSILLTVLLIVSNITTSIVCSAEEFKDSSYTVANNSYNDYMDNNLSNVYRYEFCLENPIRDGYFFAGWTLTKNGKDFVGRTQKRKGCLCR